MYGGSQESATDSFKGHGDQRILLKEGGCKKKKSSFCLPETEEEENKEKKSHHLNPTSKKTHTQTQGVTAQKSMGKVMSPRNLVN